MILDNLRSRPDVIIVESHGVLGSPSRDLIEILTGQRYYVTGIEVAEENHPKICKENDVYVISAIDAESSRR
jgi:mannose/fructose-specific phosphotransferase system component IIA